MKYQSKVIGENRSYLIYIVLVLITLFFFYPVLLIFLSSLKTPLEIFASPFSLPKKIMFGNYLRAWEKINFGIIFSNSFIITICSIIGLIVFGSMAAYVCARNKSKLANIFYLIFISCIVLPFHIAMVPLVKFMSSINLSDSYFGVIIVYIAVNMSFTIFLYTGFIRNIPIELEEAAIVDGCSKYSIFRRIVFPLISPITATVAILNSLSIWNDFLIPLLLISSPEKRNIPSALLAFQGQYNNKWDLALASLILSIIPIIIFYAVLQKNIIKGITQGSIKG
jgi:raffinose/stachyose/melibiose transport system permease protein